MQFLPKQNFNCSVRHKISLEKTKLFNPIKIIKNLRTSHKRSFGRSKISGHITVWNRGAGCKRIYYSYFHFKNNYSISIVLGINYDNFRSNLSTLNFDFLKKKFFRTNTILNTYPGSLLINQNTINDFYLGFTTAIQSMSLGTLISNLCIKKNFISLVRSAGTFAQLIQKSGQYCKVKLPSSQIITVSKLSSVTIGINSNILHRKIIVGKAGINRLRGVRPKVRGIAMNPVDHPHGGRSTGGFHPKTPWGIPTLGKKTVKKY